MYMRKKEREITNFEEIIDILTRADTLRLGINGDPYPYVVPLSFGYEANNGKITVYVHGAADGFKHELLAKDNRVCVETDIFHRYTQTEHSITTEYESVIGFGKAETVTRDEAVKGMDLLLAHCGFDGYKYDKTVLSAVKIIRIELFEITGKRRFV